MTLKLRHESPISTLPDRSSFAMTFLLLAREAETTRGRRQTRQVFMKLFRCSMLVLAMSLCGAMARASLITYDLVGAITSAGTLTGTVAIQSTTGLVQSADLTFEDASLDSPTFTTIASTAAYNGLGQDWIEGGSSGSVNYGGQAALYFDTANLSSGGSLQLCTGSAVCGTQGVEASYVEVYTPHGDAIFDLSSGTLSDGSSSTTSTATTPEPPALLLVGTGAFALAGLCAVIHARASANA